jgi:putative flippase GtrA
MKILRGFKNGGEKRLFLSFGIFNFLITNFVLQVLLLLIPTILATVISQLVNLILGYYLYGKKVFKFMRLSKYIFFKYLILAFILWIFNFGLIQYFFYYGFNKNITAIFIIPLLVIISYLSQKYFVFR